MKSNLGENIEINTRFRLSWTTNFLGNSHILGKTVCIHWV